MKELLLRAQAATKLRTSIVALTQSEFETYCTQLIKKNYPRLGNYCIEALKYLQYKSNILPDYFDPYEWWFGVVIGPNSCTRDIGDLRENLYQWYQSHNTVRIENSLTITLGDEWDYDLEYAILAFQRYYPKYLLPTGYGDNETLRRLRMYL